MKLFNGKKAAQKILTDLAARIKKEKLKPVLAVIMVGENEASKVYLKLKKEAAKKIGIEVMEYFFSAEAAKESIIKKIQELNNDKKISGVIVQLPLPAMFNADEIIGVLDLAKDVDGFHKENRRLLEKGESKLRPVLPLAILAALQSASKKDLTGKILALVNSEIFGQTLKLVLEEAGAEMNYLARNTCVILGAEKELKSADVLITVCGCPNMIKGEMIKRNAILIDAGITRYHDGKVVGDVDQKSVAGKAAFLTPVPGGLGPLTVALLLRNVYLAARNS